LNRKEGSRNPLSILKLNWLLRKINPSVVHCHEPKMIKMFFRRKFSCLLTVHDTGIPVLYQDSYDTLAAISDSVAKDVKKRFGVVSPIVYNGIDINSFSKRTDYALESNGQIRIVQVSRLMHEKKGQDILLSAIAGLKAECPEQNIRIDFIGDGLSKGYLEELAKKLNIEGLVRFQGNKDRQWIRANLSAYHILVQPSRYEGFGLTIVEGIAAGLPAVASDIEGPKEILEPFKNKLLFKKDNPDDLARILKTLINNYHNAQIKNEFDPVYVNVTSRYAINSTVRGYLQVYAHLADNQHSQHSRKPI
jgi:glycosyltransferase involved in cell wall biosynthesis